jgi:hypothetical protein
LLNRHIAAWLADKSQSNQFPENEYVESSRTVIVHRPSACSKGTERKEKRKLRRIKKVIKTERN